MKTRDGVELEVGSVVYVEPGFERRVIGFDAVGSHGIEVALDDGSHVGDWSLHFTKISALEAALKPMHFAHKHLTERIREIERAIAEERRKKP